MTASPPDDKAPSWEDYLEIFYAPSRVFARRGNKFGGPMLVLLIASALVVLGTYSLLSPLFEVETQRSMAEQMKDLTAEQRAQAEEWSDRFAWLGPVFLIAMHVIIPLILGIVLWLVGKMLGAVQLLGAGMMVATFSYFPRILSWPLAALQAAILPEDNVKSFASISFSPARFLDPATGYELSMLLMRFDIFVLWTTFLLALGLKVTGKISTEKAVIAGVVMWLLGSLQPLIAYLRAG